MPFIIGPKHHNVIPADLQELIGIFFSLKRWKHFRLTGGTCLSEYYFGHRLSEDLDLFTSSQEELDEAKKILTDPEFDGNSHFSLIRATPYIVQFFYRKNPGSPPIKLDLVKDTAARISAPVLFENTWLDSLEDILSNKMGCAISRNAVKDFLDLYQLIPASHLTTPELIDIGLVKEGGLDPLVLGNQMEFIFHCEQPAPELLGKADWKDLQLFFKRIQKECFELIRPGNSG